jgi:hypothetical protein
MSQLIFLANAGGNITLTGINTASAFAITVPAANGTLLLSDGSNNTNITNLVATGTGSFGGTLTVTGSTVLSTLSTSGDAIFGGTGEIQIPSGTTGQRAASPAQGMIRYNTSYAQYEGYNGTSWGLLGGGATGSQGDEIFVQNGRTVNYSYSIPTTKNASSVGPITLATGVSVTVPSGSRWVVL